MTWKSGSLSSSLRLPLPALLLLGPAVALAQSQPAAPVGGSPGTSAAAPASTLRIEAEHGQGRQQQWADRYACYDWARTQSGFDPDAPGAEHAGGSASGREQYRRALTACLEAKGYGVELVGPAALPTPQTLQPGAGNSSGAESQSPITPDSAAAPRSGTAQSYVVHDYATVVALKYHPLTLQVEGGYSITQDSARSALDNGWNAGLGITWTPTSALPLSIRIDGSYSRFAATNQAVGLASQATGANVAFGRESIYGGDIDARFDLPMGPRVHEYFFGGIGRYRERTVFRQVSYQQGQVCIYYCAQGYIPVTSTAQQSTTGWLSSWNAGMGFEFALASPASFFIEASYVRIGPASSRMVFVPVRFGVRF